MIEILIEFLTKDQWIHEFPSINKIFVLKYNLRYLAYLKLINSHEMNSKNIIEPGLNH